MNSIDLLILSWNNLNGFRFKILDIEYGSFDGCLFGIEFGFGDYLAISFLFMYIEIKRPI